MESNTPQADEQAYLLSSLGSEEIATDDAESDDEGESALESSKSKFAVMPSGFDLIYFLDRRQFD